MTTCYFGAQTKRLETKRPETKCPWTKRPWGQNIRGDKTSVATKRPSDKTSVGTKGPSDKRCGGQNIRGDKTSVGTKRPWGQNVRLGHIYQGQYIHTLSVGGWGEACMYST
jgi:hypothetical protein